MWDRRTVERDINMKYEFIHFIILYSIQVANDVAIDYYCRANSLMSPLNSAI